MRQLFADRLRHRDLHLVDALDLDPGDLHPGNLDAGEQVGVRRCVERHGCRDALQGEARSLQVGDARADDGIEVRLCLLDAGRGTTAWQGTLVLAGTLAPPGDHARHAAAVDGAPAVSAQVATALGATLGVATRATTNPATASGTVDAQGADAVMTMRFTLHAAGEHTPDLHGALPHWARQRVAAAPWCALAWSMLGTLHRDADLERLDAGACRETTLAEAGRGLAHALALDSALATAASPWRMQLARAIVFAGAGDTCTAQVAWALAQGAFGQVTGNADTGTLLAGMRSALMLAPPLAAGAWTCLEALGQGLPQA